MFSPQKIASSTAYPSHFAKRHVDQFSRLCMGPKCYVVQCIVNGEENLQNSPFPLGFRHAAGGGATHGHRQHVAKKFGKDRVCGSGDGTHGQTHTLTDRQTHRHTHHNTLPPLPQTK